MNFLLGLAFVGLAIFGWGAGDYYAANLARKKGEFTTFFILTFILALILIPLALPEFPSNKINTGTLGVVFLIARFEIVAGVLYLKGMRAGKISVVEPINALSIGFTAILAVGLLHENLTLVPVLLIILSLAGAALVGIKSFKGVSLNDFLVPGAFLSLISAVVYGASDYTAKNAITSLGPATALFIAMVIACALSFIGAWVCEWKNGFLEFNKLSIITGVIGGLGWIGYAYALDSFPLAYAAGMINAYPALTLILANKVGKESVNTSQLLGAILLISATIGLGYSLQTVK